MPANTRPDWRKQPGARAAWQAFRDYCDLFDPAAIARRHDIDPRTIERIYRGHRHLPKGLARAASDHLGELIVAVDTARALRSWADQGDEPHDKEKTA